MRVYVADAHAQAQRLVLIVETATLLEESSVLLCPFCRQKDSMQRIFIKKYFLFTVEGVCGIKRFTNRPRHFFKDVLKSQRMPDQVWKWLRQQLKDFYAAVSKHC
jgi:hypothetical protein